MVVIVISNAKDGGGEGHDREHISLADDQMAFAHQVIATAAGKPTVVVMINGGVISIDSLKDAAPAIINAWMPGAHGAGAVAEALFGDVNPGGKMPVTMYPSDYVYKVSMLDMSMQAGPGRSYKFYTGTPLYPFGFGLSYTTFTLSWSPSPPEGRRDHHPDVNNKDQSSILQLSASTVTSSMTYTCRVKNTGTVTGDEVVMVFISSKMNEEEEDEAPVPIKELVAFQRVTLNAGESQALTFNISSTHFSLVDVDGHRSIRPGEHTLTFTRGHGEELVHHVSVQTSIASDPIRLSTFRKWWT
jgi:uncharacterized cupredoxin-like copper-binding protein